MCDICSKLTIKTTKRCQTSLLLHLNRFHILLWYFYCCPWTSKCRLGVYRGLLSQKRHFTTHHFGNKFSVSINAHPVVACIKRNTVFTVFIFRSSPGYFTTLILQKSFASPLPFWKWKPFCNVKIFPNIKLQITSFLMSVTQRCSFSSKYLRETFKSLYHAPLLWETLNWAWWRLDSIMTHTSFLYWREKSNSLPTWKK